MLEVQSSSETVEKKSISLSLFKGVMVYGLFSIFISLFFENTLFWTFVNTAGVTAWLMHKIAMNGRFTLPFKLWLKKIKYELLSKQFNQDNKKERTQWQQIQEYQQFNIDNPFAFNKLAWFSLVSPIIGSLLLQILYFAGIGEPVTFNLLSIWFVSNLFLTLVFAGVGAGIMRFVLFLKERDEKLKYKANKKRIDTSWIDRLVVLIMLFLYVSVFVLPVSVLAVEKQTVDQFMETYDPEKKYQPYAEAVISPPLQKGTIQTQPGSEQPTQLEYYNQPEGEPNLLISLWNGLTGVGKDVGGIVKRDGGKAHNYLGKNWNNPKKMYSDAQNSITTFRNAYAEGAKEHAGQKGNSAVGIMDWVGKKAQSYWNNPVQTFKNDLGWADKNILQPYIAHSNNAAKYLQRNPKDTWMATNIVAAPFFHIKVAIESNYAGGTKQFTKDASTVLANKETYWSIAKSPFSERTQALFSEGKYAQATGRASGEASVEGAQTVAENIATGGGKTGLLVLGFAIDASKAAKKPLHLAENIISLPRKVHTSVEKGTLINPYYAKNVNYTAEDLKKLESSNQYEWSSAHAFKEHVKKDKAQLKERAIRDGKDTTSSYYSEKEYTNSVNSALQDKNNQMKITNLLNSNNPNGKIEIRYQSDKPLGMIYNSVSDSTIEAYSSLIVLKKRPDGNGYYILTSYVE